MVIPRIQLPPAQVPNYEIPSKNSLRDTIAVSRAIPRPVGSSGAELEHSDYYVAFASDRELHHLCEEIPESGQWKPANCENATSDFSLFK